MLLKMLPKDKQKELKNMVGQLVELNQKQIQCLANIQKFHRNRIKFFQDFLKNRQSVENLKIILEKDKRIMEVKKNE